MHKFFAPLAYVLHVDIERLSQVRGLHEENFINKFDELSFHKKTGLIHNFNIQKVLQYLWRPEFLGEIHPRCRVLMSLIMRIQKIILVIDAYGAEGELGVLLYKVYR